MSFCDRNVDWSYTDEPRCPHNLKAPYCMWELLDMDVLIPYPSYNAEVLAPVTASTYVAAIKSGVNAVYFGYGRLNARATADNLDGLEDIVSLCHEYGAKAYLALNVMLKDSEIEEAKNIVELAEKAKIDAFIVSDLALVSIIRNHSKAAVHASTQLGIHNRSGARWAKDMGIERIVLSRETVPEDIRTIMHDTDIEIETFVHGALCTGFSGACLFSSMLTGKSGNRGRCAQLCRQKYSCKINGKIVDEGYLLSAKDICMADKIDDLARLYVDSFKIEGRLKNRNYIEGVTGIYTALTEGTAAYNDEIADKLKAFFNRGNFTHGYWDSKDIIYKGAPNHMGVYYGKIVKIISKNLVLITAKRPVEKDDCFKVVRNKNEIGGIVATGETKIWQTETCYVCFSPNETKVGDSVYLTKTNSEFDEPRKVMIELAARFVAGEPAHVVATCRGVEYEYFGQIVDAAITEPLKPNDVVSQFIRTGDTDFEFIIQEVKVENAFVPKSVLNELRRNVISYYKRKFIDEYVRPDRVPKAKHHLQEKIKGDFVELDNIRQLNAEIKSRFKNIVFSPCNYDLELCEKFYNAAKTDDNMIFVKLPIYIPTSEEYLAYDVARIFDGIVANNVGNYFMADFLEKPVVASWTLNVANKKNPLLRWSAQTIISTELNSNELKNFPDCLVYTYGRLPLMYLNFCPKRLVYGSCERCKEVKNLSLCDAKGEYPVITKRLGNYCQHEMKNSVVTNLGTLAGNNPRYFDFTSMKVSDILAVLKKYYSGKVADTSEYNHLHFNRGVE